MKKILVTGGAGYIGSVCVSELIKDKNVLVVVIDNLVQGHMEAIHPKSVFIKGSIGNKKLLESIFKKYEFDTVFHFAANTVVSESMEKPSEFFQNNVLNSLGLLEIMREYDCSKIIFSSSSSVYGNPEYTPVDEDHPKNPLSPYGESKLVFEKILLWYQKIHNLRFLAFRYGNASGATEKLGEDHNPETNLIPIILDVALGKKNFLTINGEDFETEDGTCIRDYIHVKDIAAAHILGMEFLGKNKSGIYNIGTGNGHSIKEVVDTIRKATQKEIKTIIGKRRPGDPSKVVLDPSKIIRDLKWKPKYSSLEEITSSAWEWKKLYPEGY